LTISQKNPTTARQQAVVILQKIYKDGSYANLQIMHSLESLSDKDRRFVTELVYGTLRRQNALDYILNQLLKKTVADLPLLIAIILRISLYQLLYLKKIPPSAVVNEAVKLARRYGHRGTASLTNGVLRSYLRRQSHYRLPSRENVKQYLTITESHPAWLVDYLLDIFGEEATVSFCEYNNRAHEVIIRCNTLKIERSVLMNRLQQAGFEVRSGEFAPEAIRVLRSAGLFESELFANGLFQAQDQTSMLVSHVLQPSPTAKVLDLCAAPGGKTSHLAQLMNDQGEIRAFDLYEHRINLIDENCRRLGIKSVQTQALDARCLPDQFSGWADYLLLDAPCSGLGILGRRADARWQKSYDNILEMAQLSRSILLKAADYLTAGGVMVFSTCTVSKEENQETVEWFLKKRPDFSLMPFAELLPPTLPPILLEEAQTGMVQIMPHHADLEGFFISRLYKKK
jgi:16S rRNA (cytosine967-C5)-methyltransferase